MPAARHHAHRDGLATQRDRLRIAQLAARIIAEHGLADWTLAKRKAVRQLLLPDTTALPSNDEIEAALTDHHALFGGEAHVTMLHRQRREALAWMRRLAAWDPVLVGGVAAGWATEHTDVRLELAADDPKAVEIELAGSGVPYGVVPARAADAPTVLRIDSQQGVIRLAIFTPVQRRNRPRRNDEPRLGAEALAGLIEAESGGDSPRL
jgi:phage tail protein X